MQIFNFILPSNLCYKKFFVSLLKSCKFFYETTIFSIAWNFDIIDENNPGDKTTVTFDAPLTEDDIESIDSFERVLLKLDREALRKLWLIIYWLSFIAQVEIFYILTEKSTTFYRGFLF